MASQTITYRGRTFTKVKGFNKAVKEAIGGALVDPWWKDILPLKFTKQAYFIWPTAFKKRFVKLKAAERKRGVKPRLRDPMVATGSMRRRVLGISPSLAGSVKSGIKARLRGSNVANFHTGNNPKTGSYNMVAELRVISPADERKIIPAIDLAITKFLAEAGAVEVVQ